MNIIRLGSVFAMAALAGCVAAPPINFSVATVAPSATKVDADLRSITVTLAGPDQKTGPIPAEGLIVVAPWKEAVTDAVNRAAIFNDDSSRHATLSIKVLKFDIPAAGFTMQTDVEARYELTDRRTGGTIFDHVIASSGICPVDYAFVGVVRARESMNRAVQANIADFIGQVEQVRSKDAVVRALPVAALDVSLSDRADK